MIRSSRFAIRLLGTASLAAATLGCSLAPKTESDPVAKVTVSNPSDSSAPFNLFKSSGTSSHPEASSVSTPGTADFSTTSKLKDPVKLHLAYALWHEQEGNAIEARNSYNKVLEKNSKNVDALLGLARLDIAMSRMDDAEHRLLKAQKLAPKNPQVAVALGQYYSARGDWTRALEQMKSARLLAPYDYGCAYHLGFVQAKSGDLDSALTNFTEAVGAAEAQYNLAYILYEQGNMVAAEERLQKAIALKPDLKQAQSLLLTVREKRYGAKTQLAQGPASRNLGDAGSGVQAASHTEFARSARGMNSVPTGN